jgi:hypothetical protein
VLISVSLLRALVSSAELPPQLAWLSGGSALGIVVITVFAASMADVMTTAGTMRQQIQSVRLLRHSCHVCRHGNGFLAQGNVAASPASSMHAALASTTSWCSEPWSLVAWTHCPLSGRSRCRGGCSVPQALEHTDQDDPVQMEMMIPGTAPGEPTEVVIRMTMYILRLFGAVAVLGLLILTNVANIALMNIAGVTFDVIQLLIVVSQLTTAYFVVRFTLLLRPPALPLKHTTFEQRARGCMAFGSSRHIIERTRIVADGPSVMAKAAPAL